MLIINFKGNTPQTRFNSVGVKGNNASNKISFLIEKQQQEIDLSEFNAYLKVQNKEHDFLDKILLTQTSDSDYVYLTWEITRKSTHYRNLELQIVFEGYNADIVWQTLMFEIELGETIKVDETISEEYPTIIEQLERIVGSFEARLKYLENNAVEKSDIVDNLESSESEKVLSAKQGKVLNDKINIAISGTYKPRGSKTVAQLNAIDTSTLENGFVFNVLDSGTLNIGSVQVNAGDNVAWIIEDNVGYWDKLAGMVDLSNYVDLTSEQTITGVKTFNEKITLNNTYSDAIKIGTSNAVGGRIGTGAGGLYLTSENYIIGVNSHLRPYIKNNNDLGTSSFAWKDLYLSGKHYLGYNTSDYTLAERNWQIYHNIYNELVFARTYNSITQDKIKFNGGTIYTEDSNGNLGMILHPFKDLYLSNSAVINNNSGANSGITLRSQSDGGTIIAYSLFLQSPYLYTQQIRPYSTNIYDNGSKNQQWKDGYFAGQVYAQNTFNVINATDIVNNTLTQAQYDLITNGKPTMVKGTYQGLTNPMLLVGNNSDTTYYKFMIIGKESNGNSFVIRRGQVIVSTLVISLHGETNYFENSGKFYINISAINNKPIPNYPANTGDFALKQINGALTWAQEWYGTQAEYDALGTYDSNTIYNIIEE